MLRHWNGLRIASLKWALGLDYNTLQHRVDLGIDRITAKWTLCVDQVTILRQNGCLVLIVLHCCIKEYPLFWSRYIKMDAWFLHCCIKTDSLFWSRYIKMHAFLWLFYIAVSDWLFVLVALHCFVKMDVDLFTLLCQHGRFVLIVLLCCIKMDPRFQSLSVDLCRINRLLALIAHSLCAVDCTTPVQWCLCARSKDNHQSVVVCPTSSTL